MEGETSLRLLLRGNQHLRDAALSRADGGAKLDAGVRESLAARGVVAEIGVEDCGGIASFKRALGGDGPTQVLSTEPDLILLSVEPDLTAEPPTDPDEFQSDLQDVIRTIRDKTGSHIFVLTASTVDPQEIVSSYRELEVEPAALRAHRLDLAVMRMSFEEGISLIDADRILAELGAGDHVSSFLDYSSDACRALTDEIVRVMEDYGFLDDRPLVPQVGRT